MKYTFPAIFTLDTTDENFPQGIYLVTFPDIPNCFTQGETLTEACEMAQDALNLMLVTMEDEAAPIPTASFINDIQKPSAQDIVTLINADTLAYRKHYSKKAVKKTLSIPQWLDTLAQQNNINFSNVLQNALMQELKLV